MVHAGGRDETVHALSEYWQTELKLDLPESGQWKSRVVWPKELEDHQYLALEEMPAANLRQKIRGALFGPVQQYLPTEEVSEYLRRYAGECAMKFTIFKAPEDKKMVLAFVAFIVGKLGHEHDALQWHLPEVIALGIVIAELPVPGLENVTTLLGHPFTLRLRRCSLRVARGPNR